jgi:hypothetical protein
MTVISPSTQALAGAGVLPLMNGIVDTLDQIPLLIDEVANGARDFIPPRASNISYSCCDSKLPFISS